MTVSSFSGSSSGSSSLSKTSFFWRPFFGVIASIILFVFLLHLHEDVLLYCRQQFGMDLFASQIIELQLLSVVWIFFLGLIVDFIGARRGLIGFFIFSFIFSILIAIKTSVYISQIALEVFAIAEILLVLVILKSTAIYYRGLKFFVFLSIIYAFSTILMHFESPALKSSLLLPLPHFQHFALILSVCSFVLGVLFYFAWPSIKDEQNQYDLLKFREILRPICRLKGWAVMVSLGVLLFYSVLFFKLAVLYYFPALLNIDDGYEEAVFLFGFGIIVGFFVYAFIFKNTPYLGRIVGASLALAILCLLGIGFLSMSEELIWCLVALVGVFLGSIILVFRLLLDVAGVAGFATGCGVSLLLAGVAYSFFGATIFHGFQTVHGLAMHHMYIHLWWSGIFLLVVPMALMLIMPNIKSSFPINRGDRVKLLSTLALYWQGKSSLGSAFWLLSVLGRWIVIFILFWIVFSFWFPTTLIQLIGKDFSHHVAIDWYNLSNFGLLLSICGIIIGVFALVSVWRCGRQSRWIWRSLSRVVVVLSLLRNILLLCGVSAGIYLHFHPEIMGKYLTKPSQASQIVRQK